jgi:hypothetical protein
VGNSAHYAAVRPERDPERYGRPDSHQPGGI